VRFAVHCARQAVGDSGAEQRVIQTVPGQGFRFHPGLRLSIDSSEAGRSRSDPTSVFLCRERLEEAGKDVLSSARFGVARSLLVTGEAGIGKTQALERLTTLAQVYGFQVFTGSGNAGEVPTYWPWVQILSDSVEYAQRVNLFRGNADGSELGLAGLIGDPSSLRRALSGDQRRQARSTRFLLFESVARYLRRLCDRSLVMISIDDLHSSDTPSVQLLAYLWENVRNAHLAMVVGCRGREMLLNDERRSSYRRMVESPSCRVIELSALPEPAIRELVRVRFDVAASAEAIQFLRSKTSGNPFFITQLLAVLESSNRIDELVLGEPLGVALPSHVREAIVGQISHLPAEVLEVLKIASVVGRSFAIADLIAASEGAAEAVLDNVAIASKVGVLRRVNLECGDYEFTHELVRDAVYGTLEPGECARAHAAVGIAIESRLGGRLDEASGELSRHFAEAAALIGGDRGILYSERAASWAVKQGRFEDAVVYWKRTTTLMRSFGEFDCRRYCAVLTCLADALGRVGQRAEAQALLTETADMAGERGWRELLAQVAMMYAPDFLALETGVVDSVQVRLLERALRSVGDSDVEVKAMLLSRLALALHWSDEDSGRLEELAEKALRLSDGLVSSERASEVRTVVALARFSVEDPLSLVGVPEDGMDGDAAASLTRSLMSVTANWILGDIERVRREIERFAGLAKGRQQFQSAWYEMLWRSALAQMEGRFREAAEFRESYLRRGKLAGDLNATHSFLLQAFMASLDLGGEEAFEGGIREMVSAHPRVLGWRSGLLLLLAEAGRLEEARGLLGQLDASGALGKAKRNEWYALVGAMAIASARVGATNIGRRVYGVLERHREQLAVVGYGSFCWGSTEQLLGLASVATGELDLARVHFDRAIAINGGVGALPAVARSHMDAALACERMGLRGDVGSHQDAAVEMFEELGMVRRAAAAQRIGLH
jgi:AAA ATPase domain